MGNTNKSLVGIAAAILLIFQLGFSQNINVGELLRFACSQLVIERTDPLVNPGMNPSPHTHQIVGGNSFNVTVLLSPSTSSSYSPHKVLKS